MEIKNFRNKYGLDLIPASHSNICLGDLVKDPVFGPPDFSYTPNNIFSAFYDSEYLNEGEMLQNQNEAKKIECVSAGFVELSIDVDVENLTELKHPSIGKIGSNFITKKTKKFTFGDLEARIMSNLMRVRIDSYLDEYRKKKWEDYDGKVRRAFMITELYYGKIKMVLETQFSQEFEAEIQKLDLEASNKLSYGKEVQYTFDHKDVPFAMRTVKVKNFQG